MTTNAAPRTLAVCLLAGLLLASCKEQEPDIPQPMAVEPQPTPATEPLVADPEPEWQSEPEPPPLVDPEIVLDLAKWDAASSEEREAAARTMDERAPGFDLLRLETFTAGTATHEVAIFSHNLTSMEFVLVPASTFTMGSPPSDADRKADEVVRTVTLTRPFLIARTEVPQKDWFKHLTTRGKPQFAADDNPMENATFHDMKAFLYRSGLAFPTEAQWEYACRAGTTTRFHFGDDAKDLGEYAWFEANSESKPHPVGLKKPNAFGLFDMHGNVWERCSDRYERYDGAAVTDPTGHEDSLDMICRGGSHGNMAAAHRSAFRYPMNPGDKHSGVGLRTVWVFESR